MDRDDHGARNGSSVISRMSFGAARCGTGLADRWPLLKAVCGEIGVRIEQLRSLSPEQIRSLSEEVSEEITIGDKKVRFTTYRQSVDGGTLVVVQAFFRTLFRANYVPLERGAGALSGRMTVEGVLLTPDGQLVKAPDDLLWSFR